ncbi:MAG: hypothetical protein RLZZ391_712 [Bacteroidota bacterium]|jgi:hypothetical protein
MRYTLIILLCLSTISLPAQTVGTDKALEIAVQQFNQLSSSASYQSVYMQFEKLYLADKKNWLIPYYASLLKSRMCLLKMGERDQLANDAILWISRAKTIANNDEIYCAESLANTAKMSVNPTMRWLLYEDKIKLPLQLAKKINANNPRIYLLEANIQRKLPVLFGGGCRAAIPMAKKAEQLLHTQVLQNTNMPGWGNQSLVEFKAACPF